MESVKIDRLCNIIEKEPVDWQAFDSILSEIKDINAIDEEDEETLLTSFLTEGFYSRNGFVMPEAIRHFLNNGYDVKAHNGRNGGLALSQLCWSSYDRCNLDAAKVLLDAGAVIDFRYKDDDPNEETGSVLANIEWKLSAAWHVDKDFDWANVLTAYYFMVKAVEEKKDYRSIESFHVCIGRTLTKTSIILPENGEGLKQENGVTTFEESLLFWFEDKLLVIRKYVEFLVDPIKAEDESTRIQPADEYFKDIIGSKLIKMQYINEDTCFLDFDNGVRILFANYKGKERGESKGAFEILEAKIEDIQTVDIHFVLRNGYLRYSDNATRYDELSLALINENDTYLLYSSLAENDFYYLECIKCSRHFIKEFCNQFLIAIPEEIYPFHSGTNTYALRIKCDKEYLYIKTSPYIGLEIAVSDDVVDLTEKSYLGRPGFGKHIKFIRVEN